MNGQQAPTSWPTVSGKQSVRSAPRHTASSRRNLNVGHASAAKPMTPSTVNTELPMLLNNRPPIQPSTLVRTRGGGAGAIISPRTKPDDGIAVIAALPIDRSHAGIIPVHQDAGGERE